MKFEFTIARRFAFPGRGAQRFKPTFVSLIATAGIMLGTAALILTLAIVRGFSDEIQSKVIGFGAHLTLSHRTGTAFAASSDLEEKLRSVPDVVAVSPYLAREVIVKSVSARHDSRQQSVQTSLIEPAILRGVVPERDVTFIREKIIAGNYLKADSAHSATQTPTVMPMVMGKKLAVRLGVRVGDTLTVIASGMFADGAEAFAAPQTLNDALATMRVRQGRIVGIYETGLSQGFDDAVVLTGLREMQAFLELGDSVSGYEAKVNDVNAIDRAAEVAADGVAFPLGVQSVFELYAGIFIWLRLQENIIPLLVVMVTIVAAFNIVSTLLIIVLEKTGEVGVLLSFGATAENVRRIFMSQAALMSCIGVLLGDALAFGLCVVEKNFGLVPLSEATYFISKVPIAIVPVHYLSVSVIAITICLLAAFVPSSIAARLKPIDAIRF
ncbi:MAG: ABC transporter permease [Rhizobacter sp.]|nr:ABC transporter permease [Chlorobiales bacterium]